MNDDINQSMHYSENDGSVHHSENDIGNISVIRNEILNEDSNVNEILLNELGLNDFDRMFNSVLDINDIQFDGQRRDRESQLGGQRRDTTFDTNETSRQRLLDSRRMLNEIDESSAPVGNACCGFSSCTIF